MNRTKETPKVPNDPTGTPAVPAARSPPRAFETVAVPKLLRNVGMIENTLLQRVGMNENQMLECVTATSVFLPDPSSSQETSRRSSSKMQFESQANS